MTELPAALTTLPAARAATEEDHSECSLDRHARTELDESLHHSQHKKRSAPSAARVLDANSVTSVSNGEEDEESLLFDDDDDDQDSFCDADDDSSANRNFLRRGMSVQADDLQQFFGEDIGSEIIDAIYDEESGEKIKVEVVSAYTEEQQQQEETEPATEQLQQQHEEHQHQE